MNHIYKVHFIQHVCIIFKLNKLQLAEDKNTTNDTTNRCTLNTSSQKRYMHKLCIHSTHTSMCSCYSVPQCISRGKFRCIENIRVGELDLTISVEHFSIQAKKGVQP